MNLRFDESIVVKWVRYLVSRGRTEATGMLRVCIRILFTKATQSRAHQTDPEVLICREQNRGTAELSIAAILVPKRYLPNTNFLFIKQLKIKKRHHTIVLSFCYSNKLSEMAQAIVGSANGLLTTGQMEEERH